jgi:hypothetical protein
MKNPEQLHDLVTNVLRSLQPLANYRSSFFVNDITADLPVNTDKDILAMVFGNIVRTTIGFSENGCIRISATSINDTVLLNIKQCTSRPFTDIADSVEAYHTLAAKLGGAISVVNDPMTGTAVAICFQNKKAA